MKIEYKMPDHCVEHDWSNTLCGVSDIEINKKTAQRWFQGCFTSEPPASVRVVDDKGKTLYLLTREGVRNEEVESK